MTTSSGSKDNPKGGRKSSKQAAAVSSSLKSIMKYGGSSVGNVKEGNKKNLGGKNDGIGKQMKRDTRDKTSDIMEVDTDMEGKTGNEAKATNIKVIEVEMNEGEETKDELSMGAEQGNPEGEGGRKNESTNIGMSEEDSVRKWESEVENWEKERKGAATVEYKEMAERKLEYAQLMLKEALLRMTVTYDKSGNDSDDLSNEEDLQEETVIMENGSNGDDKGELSGDEKARQVVHGIITTNNDMFGDKTGRTDKEEHIIDSSTNQKKGRVTEIENWGDISSDDETVVQDNQESTEWKTVVTRKTLKTNKTTQNSSKNDKNGNIGIKNPYDKNNSNIMNWKQQSDKQQEVGNKSSLTSYLEITKDKMRKRNTYSIRVNMSFTPRTSGSGELMRIARELLTFGSEIDDKILLLPWDEQDGFGPINLDDLSNPRNLGENIRKYFNKPSYITLQPGSPVYGIGLHMSTELPKYEFMTRWNLHKQEYKKNNRSAYSLTLAPMQNSPTAYIIGIAVGSTEKQDYELLNKKLSMETGIDGIEVSFQNINQAGVTQDFWKLANDKAMMASKDKYSREHLNEKYRWAPNSLAIYVPRKELVPQARKTMINKYGKSKDGNDPIWPDGSTMRFLPIKGQAIKNEKTRNIVRKRLAYHIWLKVNEITFDTNFTNIYDTIEEFDGLTFAEIILQMTNSENQRVFSHINRSWSQDPSKERWAISVKSLMADSATRIVNNLHDTLLDRFGPSVNQFFTKNTNHWAEVVKTQPQDDEDDWFDDDDDIDEVINKGLVDSTLLPFFGGTQEQDDKSSVASWGTGNTAYTEIVSTNKDNGSTGVSSITHDSSVIQHDELEKRKDIVRVRLKLRNITDNEIDDIMEKKAPYELAFSGVHLSTWDAEKEVFMILAIREQFTPTNPNK
jgi:hypothetical protein